MYSGEVEMSAGVLPADSTILLRSFYRLVSNTVRSSLNEIKTSLSLTGSVRLKTSNVVWWWQKAERQTKIKEK
jgi:hypothetical protein